MEIFYSDNIAGGTLRLSPDDSVHCARVLRHRVGDGICVIDGVGTMYDCRITLADPRGVEADIVAVNEGWHSHPYRLTMAVCPTKNNDRYEWFVEKATEIGVDMIQPLIGERSERKVFKSDRARKIALSGTKQSLKSLIPAVAEPISVKDFLKSDVSGLKMIAYCFEDETVSRISIAQAIKSSGIDLSASETVPQITVLIGPEGDFSPEEAALALKNGYIPIHLGPSRLRTETAAVVAAAQVYTMSL